MQMFVLDMSPSRSARYLCDAHIRVIGREISMCLSSWYAQHMGYADELPYKQFNHPVGEQFDCVATRVWAALNASVIFIEFERRFGKEHASFPKFQKLTKYRAVHHDNPFPVGEVSLLRARFSFIEKGVGVVRDLSLEDAVQRYRQYYRNKVSTMRVPVVWTDTERPDWLCD